MNLDYYVERPLWQHFRHSAREHGYRGVAVLYYVLLVLFRYYVCLSVYSWIPTSGMRVWFLRRIGVRIGRNVQIGPLNWFDFVWPEYIEVGDGTSIAGMTTIIAHSTPLHHLSGYFKSYVGPVRIGKNVWIAVNCTILSNLSIGGLLCSGSRCSCDERHRGRRLCSWSSGQSDSPLRSSVSI